MVMIPAKQAPAANAPAAGSKVPPKVTPAAAPAPAAAQENTAGPAAENAAAPAAAPAAVAPAPAAAPAATTAIAARPAGAVAVATRPVDVVKQAFQDAFKVDWNTLHRIQANNGNFLDLEENKKPIGTELVLELMSYQDNWQISPGTDDENDIQYVRYSDDGVTTTEGEDCQAHLEALKVAGYTDASMRQRVVLAGTVVGGSYDGKLVQLNLPTTSKAQFDRFRMQVSVDVSRGKRQPDDARVLKLRATVQSKGKNSWTVVMFDYAN